jgi:alkanesulfonate monooxygenase SsuD/methylene tetrahydromethanopterin reductase-like flavin-dependent oxidoreductase (luciferase family)
MCRASSVERLLDTPEIANGRLDFGMGAGWNVMGAGWNVDEHESMGIPLYPPGERIRHLHEACQIIKWLLTQPTVDFDGRYYHLADARSEPKPVQRPYPPFVIGGGGEQLTLRVVAKPADVWNYMGGSIDEFTQRSAFCASIVRRSVAIRRRSCSRFRTGSKPMT